MRKITLFSILLFGFIGTSFSQGCLPDGISFLYQEQIDNFQDNYPGCTEIEGDVVIKGSDINNLNGLIEILSINGNLLIDWNISLSNLSGLDNLTNIGGYLRIHYNEAITTLTGLENLTTVGDYLSINSNNSLTNLNALENLTFIGGDLSIGVNESLASLTGLENLTLIDGGIFIYDNLSITNLNGLENVNTDSIDYVSIWENTSLAICNAASICGFLASPTGPITIYNNAPGCNNPTEIANACGIMLPCLPFGNYYFNNQADIDNFQTNYPGCEELQGSVTINGSDIANLNGLNELTSIDEYLSIRNNDLLTNLSGLENLNSIGGGSWVGLSILDNNNLSDITALEELTFLGGALTIMDNPALSSIQGLQNINADSLDDLHITNNISLSDCEVASLCNYLASPTGSVTILNNATGCNSPIDVAGSCGITLPCLPYGNYYFNDQADIDNFQTFYPGCTELEGYVEISGSNITNLNGLNIITTVGDGGLYISDITSLTNVAGLDNLTSVGGYLWFKNNTALESLVGLENLTSIEGNLIFDNNEALHSLSGLDNLFSIGGHLSLSNNNTLTSLSGLDNINAGTISYLRIINNSSLSTCEVKSVCDYLASPSANIYIYQNAIGCNNEEEVHGACDEADVNEIPVLNELKIYPNPFIQTTTFKFELMEPAIVEIKIYNHLGVEVYKLRENQYQGYQEINWNSGNLPSGIYFCIFKTNDNNQTIKIIKL